MIPSTDLLNHLEFAVTDGNRSGRFYLALLAPLSVGLAITIDPECTTHGGARYGFGRNGYPSLWIYEALDISRTLHLAFTATSRAQVDECYEAALAAHGRDNGFPGIRERYHSNYYAAYILDPDGNNIEIVCQNANA